MYCIVLCLVNGYESSQCDLTLHSWLQCRKNHTKSQLSQDGSIEYHSQVASCSHHHFTSIRHNRNNNKHSRDVHESEHTLVSREKELLLTTHPSNGKQSLVVTLLLQRIAETFWDDTTGGSYGGTRGTHHLHTHTSSGAYNLLPFVAFRTHASQLTIHHNVLVPGTDVEAVAVKWITEPTLFLALKLGFGPMARVVAGAVTFIVEECCAFTIRTPKFMLQPTLRSDDTGIVTTAVLCHSEKPSILAGG